MHRFPLLVPHVFLGNGQRVVYPLFFWSNGGIGQTRPREAPTRAPGFPKFSSDALARCPQTLPSTHTFLFFSSRTLLGLTGPRRTRGLWDLTACWRGMPPEIKFTYYPRVTVLSPRLTEIIPLHDHLWQPQQQVRTHLHVTVHPNSPRAEQPANNWQLRAVAIDFFGKKQCLKSNI